MFFIVFLFIGSELRNQSTPNGGARHHRSRHGHIRREKGQPGSARHGTLWIDSILFAIQLEAYKLVMTWKHPLFENHQIVSLACAYQLHILYVPRCAELAFLKVASSVVCAMYVHVHCPKAAWEVNAKCYLTLEPPQHLHKSPNIQEFRCTCLQRSWGCRLQMVWWRVRFHSNHQRWFGCYGTSLVQPDWWLRWENAWLGWWEFGRGLRARDEKQLLHMLWWTKKRNKKRTIVNHRVIWVILVILDDSNRFEHWLWLGFSSKPDQGSVVESMALRWWHCSGQEQPNSSHVAYGGSANCLLAEQKHQPCKCIAKAVHAEPFLESSKQMDAVIRYKK